MTKEYKFIVIGMSCQKCKEKVTKAISTIKDISKIDINLESKTASLVSNTKITKDGLQQVLTTQGVNYTVYNIDDVVPQEKPRVSTGTGIFYCPMQCEGDKTYDKMTSCPICGMDLVEQPNLDQAIIYTCPTHFEIEQTTPGFCSICAAKLIVKEQESEENKTYKKLLNKLIITICFSLPVFIISMGEHIPGRPLEQVVNIHYLNWLQLILTIPIVFYTCSMFFVRAWNSIINWNLNMFTLIGIGTGIAFIFSICALLFPNFFPDEFKTDSGSVYLYFEATAVILTLAMLGQVLEARAHSQTNSAIKELLKLSPAEANILINGEEKLVSISEIEKGNLLKVKPGEKIPVDGIIIEGESSIDESMITGEPIPVDKYIGNKVISGTINGNQSFIMKAEKVGTETLLSQIIKMVNDASRSRAPIQKVVDNVSKYFVPIVVIISIVTFFIWVVFGPSPAYSYALINAIAVLIIACPCALGLATPMSIMVGVGKGAGYGILVKNAQALELMNKVDVLITDKTGTITEGKPSLETVYAKNGDSDKLLQIIASVNQDSEHPLAKAIIESAKSKSIKLLKAENFNSITGKGVTANIDDNNIAIGNTKLLEDLNTSLSDDMRIKANEQQSLGKTISYIVLNGNIEGFIVISDRIKYSSKKAIEALHNMGIEVVMATGDNINTARYVSNEVGIKQFKGEYLPQDKLKMVEELQNQGKIVAMTGDGINDSPALAKSNVGIAMGTGTDVAIESSEITLVKGDLIDIVKLKKLSLLTMNNIKQNLFFAFIYNTLGVPIAAGILFPFFGILLSPMIAALAMSLSSVSVITNSLRLRGLHLE